MQTELSNGMIYTTEPDSKPKRRKISVIDKFFIWLAFGVILNFSPTIIEYCHNVLYNGIFNGISFNFQTIANGEMFLITICIVGSGLSEVALVKIDKLIYKIIRRILLSFDIIIGLFSTIEYSLYKFGNEGTYNNSIVFNISMWTCISSIVVCSLIIFLNNFEEVQ